MRNQVKRRFAEEPTFLKIAVGLTFYNAVVFFEELVIDRYGLWHYLPLYKVGKLCVWDYGVLLAIGGFTAVGIARKLRTHARARTDHPTSVKLLVGLMFANTFVLAVAILDRYGALANFPPLVLLLVGIALLTGVGWWLRRRPLPASSFADQPTATKIAAGLAVYNGVLFLQHLVIHPSVVSLWELLIPLSIGLTTWWVGRRPEAPLDHHAPT